MQDLDSMRLVSWGKDYTMMLQSLPFNPVLALSLVITIITASLLLRTDCRNLREPSGLAIGIVINFEELFRRLLLDFFVVRVPYDSFGGMRLCRH